MRHTHIQDAYDALRAQPLSERSVQQAHGVLSMALRQTVKWGYIAYCPTELVESPRPPHPHKEMQPLTANDARTLFVARGHRLHALWVVLVTIGVRLGQATALTWGDIDFGKKTLQVRRTVHSQVGKGLVFNEPKTTRSRRTLDLSAVAVAALQQHRKRQLEERLAVGSQWQALDFVFCTAIGKPLNPGYLKQAMDRLLKTAGLPSVRVHDLRHTAATLMLERNVSIKAVQNALGHSTATLTMNRYAHLTTDMQREAVRAMDAVFSDKNEAVSWQWLSNRCGEPWSRLPACSFLAYSSQERW